MIQIMSVVIPDIQYPLWRHMVSLVSEGLIGAHHLQESRVICAEHSRDTQALEKCIIGTNR